MSLAMSRTEREAFPSDVHVAVLSVHQDGRGPIAVPVWYSYQPGGTVNVITGAASRKARLIAATGRFSLCVQSEAPPYRYVSVEGPATVTVAAVDPVERRDLAYRYLGQDFGDMYLQTSARRDRGSVVIRMVPDAWLSTDFAKQFSRPRG
jgi:PPOX class probable F420-dependent enzyme